MSYINLTHINETLTEYSSLINGDTITILSTNSTTHNTPPTLSDFWFVMQWNDEFDFNESLIDNATSGLQAGEQIVQIRITSLPTRGTLQYNNIDVVLNQVIPYDDLDNLTYIPNPNTYGMPHDEFTIQIADSGGNPNRWSNQAVVTVYVRANTPPQISDNDVCIESDTLYQFNKLDFLQNYVDLQNNLPTKIKLITLPTNELSLAGILCNVGDEILISQIESGDLIYESHPLQIGRPSDSFQFAVTDDTSAMYSNAVTLRINSNNKPSVTSTSRAIYENSIFEFSYQFWTGIFIDADGDLPHIIIIESLPNRGNLEYNSLPVSVGQQIIIDPTNNLLLRFIPEQDTYGNGYAQFNFRIIDSCEILPLTSNMGEINIDVAHVNHPPEAGDFAIQMCPNSTFDFYQQLFIDEFDDQDGDSLAKIRFNTLPAAGQLLYNNTPIVSGQEFTTSQIDDISYQSDSDDLREYIFDYQASDGQAWSNVAQIDMQIKSDADCYYNNDSQVLGNWES